MKNKINREFERLHKTKYNQLRQFKDEGLTRKEAWERVKYITDYERVLINDPQYYFYLKNIGKFKYKV